MISVLKAIWWRWLAACLGWGAGAICRRPCGWRPEDWRAVEFSYSHFGEDLVILRLLHEMPPSERGVYVDVGAFDPVRHSNTYLLYLHGWRGVNIDASPARVAPFQRARPDDKNVVAAVSDRQEAVVFAEYPTSGTSRVISANDAIRANGLGEEPLSATPSRTETLTSLLDRMMPDKSIDFLNIDCEGHDLAVLRGLDWARWTPRVIAVEGNTPNDQRALVAFLHPRGYRLVSKHLVTLIFLHETARSVVPLGMWPEADGSWHESNPRDDSQSEPSDCDLQVTARP